MSVQPSVNDAQIERFLNSREVRYMFGLTPVQLYQRRKAGQFPEPDVVLGKRGLLWKASTIDAWVKASCPCALATCNLGAC